MTSGSEMRPEHQLRQNVQQRQDQKMGVCLPTCSSPPFRHPTPPYPYLHPHPSWHLHNLLKCSHLGLPCLLSLSPFCPRPQSTFICCVSAYLWPQGGGDANTHLSVTWPFAGLSHHALALCYLAQALAHAPTRSIFCLSVPELEMGKSRPQFPWVVKWMLGRIWVT